MKKKLPLMIGLICSSCSAMAEDYLPDDAEIFTDDFKIVANTPDKNRKAGDTADINAVKLLNVHDAADSGTEATEIGTLSEMKVIRGEKAENSLAYVKNSNNDNYIIKNTIIVKCRKGTDCIPAGYSSEQITGTSFYRVTVTNLDEWKQAMADLKLMPDVITFAPDIDNGSALKLD